MMLTMIRNKPHTNGKKTTHGTAHSFESWTVWSFGFMALWVFCLSLTLSGLAILKKNIEQIWAHQTLDFKWMVLTQGSILEIDEVGRVLGRFEGVKEVVFIPPEKAFADLQQDPFLANDMQKFSAEFLPPTWQVTWESHVIAPHQQREAFDEIKRIPNVLDVAYDERSVAMINDLRQHWLHVRFVVAVAITFGLIAILLVMGRYLFHVARTGAWNWKIFGANVLIAEACWVFGAMVMWVSLHQPVPWVFYTGGVLLGGSHYLWQKMRLL